MYTARVTWSVIVNCEERDPDIVAEIAAEKFEQGLPDSEHIEWEDEHE